MTLLTLTSNNVANPQTIDLSAFVDVQPGDGLDPADPAFTQRVWSRSLLKEGATLALEQTVEREMQFPLRIGPVGGATGAPGSLSATLKVITQVNAILESPGATMTWQPPGASQATTFDVLSGLCESAYNYFAQGQGWEIVNLRVFTMPFGRAAGPRPYATASATGPLLMISPYASGGALATVPSSVGFGASGGAFNPNGASGGISYLGSPSLAGDAPAQLQVSYVGPLPNGATNAGVAPLVALSLLPDQYYRPLVTVPEVTQLFGSQVNSSTAVASSYITVGIPGTHDKNADNVYAFSPLLGASSGVAPTAQWAGEQRLFAIARASSVPGWLTTLTNELVSYTTTATVYPGDWQMVDLGTYGLTASQAPAQKVQIAGQIYSGVGGASCALDVTAFVVVPDRSTWFLNPTAIQGAAYGYAGLANPGVTSASAPYTNTFLLDDVVGGQFIYAGASQTSAPSPLGAVASSAQISAFSRGLVPRPDPKDGLPILAVFSVAQPNTASNFIAGASWVSPLNLRTMAQVNVLERTRYLLP